MARHVIKMPNPWGERELVWDDEAGTVEGDDYQVAHINRLVTEGGIPLDLSGDGQILILNDPLRDPRDFWRLLPYKMWKEPLRSTLPAVLRDVEPTPARAAEPPRIFENGKWRPMIPGVEFVW